MNTNNSLTIKQYSVYSGTADIFLAYRLLRDINSVYFGLSKKVNSIKQAIILLGRQIPLSACCRIALEQQRPFHRPFVESLLTKRHHSGNPS